MNYKMSMKYSSFVVTNDKGKTPIKHFINILRKGILENFRPSSVFKLLISLNDKEETQILSCK